MSASVPLTETQFREMFSRAFKDIEVYPSVDVEAYLVEATNLLDPNLWGDLLPRGLGLYTAHYLTLDQIAVRQAQAGLPAQGQSGAIASKSVGGASVSFDTGGASEGEDAGHWSLTTWGKRFYHLCQLVGMGGAQLTGQDDSLTEPVLGSVFGFPI